MRFRRIGIVFSAVAVASLGIIVPTSTAFAAGPTVCPSSAGTVFGQGGAGSSNPNGNSGDCPVTGTITIGAVFAIADDFSGFTVGLNGAPSPLTYAGDILVEANNLQNTGYAVTETLANGAFTSGANLISGANVEAGRYSVTPGTFTPTPGYVVLNNANNASNGSNQDFFASQIPGAGGTGWSGITGAINANCKTPVSGWDCYGVPDYYLTGSTSYPPGTYTGTVDFDLWVN